MVYETLQTTEIDYIISIFIKYLNSIKLIKKSTPERTLSDTHNKPPFTPI